MKTKLEIQFLNTNTLTEDIEKMVKEDIKGKKVKLTQITNLNIYFKPETNEVFYVADMKNGDILTSDALKVRE